MKKQILLTLLACLALIACKKGQSEKDTDEEGGKGSNTSQNAITDNAGNMTAAIMDVLGTYTGMFGNNKITIGIKNLMPNGEVTGYSVVAGNSRPFSGSYLKKGEEYLFSVKEPGDDKYDGEFDFTIPASRQNLVGKWVPFNKGKVPEKTYNLAKKEFKYNTQDGQYAHVSQNVLSVEEVENTTKTELRMMRNEMYARHGYSFKMKDMRAYFENQDWYMPLSTDVRNMLTPIEKKNEELIKRYEKYAKEYYDEYGR